MSGGAPAVARPEHCGTVSGRKHHGCTCLDCFGAVAQWARNARRLKAYGKWEPFVSPARAMAHLAELMDLGMTGEQLAHQAGRSREYVRALGAGKHSLIRPETEAWVLALRFSMEAPDGKCQVAALGSLRRIRALHAIGWPMITLSARLGLGRQVVTNVQLHPVLSYWKHCMIELAFEDLRDQDPRRYGVSVSSARRCITYARQMEWAAPNQWHGDMDDPRTLPGAPVGDRYAKPAQGDRGRHVIEDVCELAMVGCWHEEIEERLGVTWEAIARTFDRAGEQLPVRLAR